MSPNQISSLRGKGSIDVGPAHAEDSWCIPSSSVAEVVGCRVEELVLLQRLRDELLSKQVGLFLNFLVVENRCL